jgi:hypothetical protein
LWLLLLFVFDITKYKFCINKNKYMLRVAWLILFLLMPFQVIAWEDDKVLSFISQANPIIQAQHNVTKAYAKPDSVTWALQNTSISGRLGFGGTDFRDRGLRRSGAIMGSFP